MLYCLRGDSMKNHEDVLAIVEELKKLYPEEVGS